MTDVREHWVVVADGAHARFLALKGQTEAARGARHLVEASRLDNPQHTVKGRRDARKIAGGRDTGRGGLAPHGYTDHRDQHEAEMLRRFADKIARHLAGLRAGHDVGSIDVVAEPRMLGLLRAALAPAATAGVRVRELARDYTWCSVRELEEHLEANGLN